MFISPCPSVAGKLPIHPDGGEGTREGKVESDTKAERGGDEEAAKPPWQNQLARIFGFTHLEPETSARAAHRKRLWNDCLDSL